MLMYTAPSDVNCVIAEIDFSVILLSLYPDSINIISH